MLPKRIIHDERDVIEASGPAVLKKEFSPVYKSPKDAMQQGDSKSVVGIGPTKGNPGKAGELALTRALRDDNDNSKIISKNCFSYS